MLPKQNFCEVKTTGLKCKNRVPPKNNNNTQHNNKNNNKTNKQKQQQQQQQNNHHPFALEYSRKMSKQNRLNLNST